MEVQFAWQNDYLAYNVLRSFSGTDSCGSRVESCSVKWQGITRAEMAYKEWMKGVVGRTRKPKSPGTIQRGRIYFRRVG